MSGHPGHPSIGGHYGHQRIQQPHSMGPGGPSYAPLTSQRSSDRGAPPGMPPSRLPAPSPSPYHPLHHSQADSQPQHPHHHPHQPMPHHHQHHHPMHPPPQAHHPRIPRHQRPMGPPPQYSQPHQSHQHQPQSNPRRPSNHHQIPRSEIHHHNGLNGDWQSDNDTNHRKAMIQNIVKLLQQRDKNTSPEWLMKLPQMCKQLEVSLYRNAPSFEAYADKSTLKDRLQKLAMDIADRTNSEHDRRGEHRQGYPSSTKPSSRNESHGSHASHGSHTSSSPYGYESSPRVKDFEHRRMHSSGPSRYPVISGPSNPHSASPHTRKDPKWENIKHKQDRLLLLHHAFKCTYESNCPHHPYCSEMKKLWKHMPKCNDPDCQVPHCYSSRSILSHYEKCQDVNCHVCVPVRKSVKEHKAKQNKSMPLPNEKEYHANMPTHNGDMLNGSMDSRDPYFNPNHSYHGKSPSRSPNLQNDMTPSHPGKYNPHRLETTREPNGYNTHSRPDRRRPPMNEMERKRPERHDDQEKQRIKHKVQRLVLLRHASRCKAKEGECTVTPYCAEMKALWNHVRECQKSQCDVPHCMSSRYVLSHYKRCKDPSCPSCVQAKEIMKKESLEEGRKRPHSVEPPQNYYAEPKNDTFQEPPIKKPKIKSEDLIQSIDTEQSQDHTPEIKRSPEHIVSHEAESKKVPPKIPAVLKEKVETVKKEVKEETNYSLINSFTVEQIETHILSLNRTIQLPRQALKAKCTDILKSMQNHTHGWVFNEPVDPKELGLPDYFDIIKKPMDLGTIAKKLHHENYHSIEEFHADVILTFDNALKYNEEGSVVNGMALELKKKYLSDYEKLLEQLNEEEENRRNNERACCLCGCETLHFEPPVFFCNGLKCTNKRISRKRFYYFGSSGNNKYYWCNQCYNELDETKKIDFPEGSLKKQELEKKKNDEVHEESWVQCDTCNRWIHQICGLFNSRQNKDNSSKFSCPHCLCKDMKEGRTRPQRNALSAQKLPRTKLSEWLESQVNHKVFDQFKVLAEEKAELEKLNYDEAYKKVRNGGAITIRQVTSTDRKLDVRERMRKRYAHKNYPEEFSFRCKCIVVFQKLDGVDVLLFALYVYEHGEDNPLPNQRTVYISYLDSVHFMRPRNLRTFVYHEILIAYLDYARKRGFSTAHIWACPPLKGDDYIFYAKPEDQKTPKDTRLRQWYIDMLQESQKRGIVGKLSNMYDLYFSNKDLDATAVPYHDGDYFMGEAENIIKNLEDSGKSKSGTSGKKSKKKKGSSKCNGSKAKSKNQKGRKGTRSTGLDDVNDDTCEDKEDQENFSEGTRDQVMVEMGKTIQPMKDSFIVAFLNWDGAKEENLVVPKKILEERERRRKQSEDQGTSKQNGQINSISTSSMIIKTINEGLPDKVGITSSTSEKSMISDDNSKKIIDDDLEELDCEFLNNRQAFLNLCRGNHYQFDELRRAKHTSMMVLWHLHNRGAAKFVQQCSGCSKEILSGTRYTCKTCSDFDLCEDCYKNPNTNRGLCNHPLVAKSVDGESSQKSNNGNSSLTDAQIKDRQTNIRLHIQLIEHASKCNLPSCTSSNCAKMKNYLDHASKCKQKSTGECKICRRIWTLLRYHAQSCKNKTCSIPQCLAIREKIRQISRQQQAMDDRRRQEMNRHYGMGGTST
mmetsp:Transcript_16450/g.23398  ORF Transcript_16450/g.23398 Transcript_16450/m.23398 type:complete len:1651 (+) Transcript_16450:347-5299(+)